jgi:antirestriction protein ArdC
MTFNQARQAGYKIKKGSKASHIEMWKPATRVEEDANGEDQEKSGMLCRIYSVFNAEQIEGIPPLSEEPPREVHANDLAEKIASNCGCAIHHGGAEAFYSPANDTINIPRQRDFFSDSAYYHTLMHEISHSTGHKSRLNRDMSCNRGSESYALEELRAELGGAFVCKDIGLITDEQAMDFHIEQHAAYIKVWLQVLKNDKKKLLSAISDANKIANYVAEYRDGQKEAQVA